MYIYEIFSINLLLCFDYFINTVFYTHECQSIFFIILAGFPVATQLSGTS